jgi:hypothetical protein
MACDLEAGGKALGTRAKMRRLGVNWMVVAQIQLSEIVPSHDRSAASWAA